METVINYIVESSIGLGILTVIYRLMLRKRGNLGFNRLFLIFSIMFSAILPFLSFSFSTGTPGVNLPEYTYSIQTSNLLETITVYTSRANREIISFLQASLWMMFIYIIGIIILSVRIFFGLYKLRFFKRKAMLEKYPKYTLVNTQTNLEPFSFFRFVFINKNSYEEDEFLAIINHELAHIQLKHTIDNLFLEIILIIQWFNPFAWVLRRDLKEIQEFQADRDTLNSGINPLFYKELLLCRAMGTRFAFSNYFNQLLIKKRLKMINNKINKSIGVVRISVVAIATGLLLFVFACEQKSVDGQQVYTVVEKMPEFNGGIEGVRAFVAENLQYPEDALKEGIQGSVFVSFVVSDKGKVTDAKVERGVSEELDAEALRVINLLPDWIPGMEKGENVSVKFTMPIVFAQNDKDEVFVVVEDMPQFEGGMDGMRDFIRKNVLYPAEAKNKSIEGKALVDFVVDNTGNVTHVKIKRSSGNEFLDKEAVRVVQSMPDWKPGSQRGQNVDVQFTIPIEFMMTDKGGAIVVKETETIQEQMSVKVDFVNENNKIRATGIVKDNSNKPLPGVTVIIKGSTKGTITDNNGNFSLEIGSKSDVLVFSFIGKKTVIVQQ